MLLFSVRIAESPRVLERAVHSVYRACVNELEDEMWHLSGLVLDHPVI